MPRSRAVTVADVAASAGVSPTTVSFVLNGVKPVRPETRDRVLAAVAELGYRAHAHARALASRRSRVIALLFPADERSISASAGRFITAAARRAHELDHQLVLWPSDSTAESVRTLTASGLADGVILMEVALEDFRAAAIAESDLPLVMIGRTADPSGTDFIDIDFARAVEDALDLLSSGPPADYWLVDSLLPPGFPADYGPAVRIAEAFRRARPRGRRLTVDESAAGGRTAAEEIARLLPRRAAIVLTNEHAAFGLTAAIRNAGLRVPDDVSIVLVNADAEIGAATDPVLDTLRSPGPEMGARAAEILIAQLEDTGRAEPAAVLERCSHVRGRSTIPSE